MNFWNRYNKSKIVNENLYDFNLRCYGKYVEEAAAVLAKRVVDAYVKNIAINIYENSSADYKKAKEDYEKATSLVHCAIGEYDCRRAEYENYRIKYEFDFSKIHDSFPTSHELVEMVIRKIILKNS